MITRISTRDMIREEWLAERRKSIGGSDAGAVLGLNEYTSRYSLWAEKTGKVIPEDISDKEAVRLGNDLEEYVAKRFEEATGKTVRRCNYILRNDDYPFAHADVDRLVVGEKAGFEAKTTSSYDILHQCMDGEFPDKWYCQVCHYMMVTGFDRWYLGVLCFGHGFYTFTIERNEDEIAALAAAEREFWSHVESGDPPGVDGSEATLETIRTLYPKSEGGTVDLTAMELSVRHYLDIKAKIAELKAEMDEEQAAIMEFMQDTERGAVGNITVSYKTSTRRSFDKEAFEAANGKISDEYYTITTTRPFKVTEKKERK